MNHSVPLPADCDGAMIELVHQLLRTTCIHSSMVAFETECVRVYFEVAEDAIAFWETFTDLLAEMVAGSPEPEIGEHDFGAANDNDRTPTRE